MLPFARHVILHRVKIVTPKRANHLSLLTWNRFISEGVYDLKRNLRSHNSDLLVRWGKLENVVEAIVKQLKENGDEVKNVYFQKEVSQFTSLRPCALVVIRARSEIRSSSRGDFARRLLA